MAHLALLHDADPARRDRFVAGVRQLFAELPGTTTGAATAGPVTCLWAAAPAAPIDLHLDGDRLALLIGYAVNDAGIWATARELADAWLAEGSAATAHDGYHVGVAYDAARGLAAGGDPFGLFPLYHATFPSGAVAISSTPEAFTCHPEFRWAIDRPALARILLVHGLVENRPLLASIRRVPAGHRLTALPGRPVTEQQVFRIEGLPPPPDETFEETRERIDGELLRALRRHRPAGDDTLIMLSGGLDSRLVAGCLDDLGIPTRAVSFGRPDDYEVRAATAVATRLGLPHELISTERADAGFVSHTRRAARFLHLSSAPGGDDFALGLAAAATQARFVWSGIPFDWIFEPVNRLNGYDTRTGEWSFARMLTHVGPWGIPLNRLPALLGADGAELCSAAITDIERQCTAGPLPPERQSAVVRWDHRVRNHLAAALHQTSFSAWPLMPATDRRFFQAVFGLPLPTFTDRRLEEAILITRRPDLAKIPLDTNSFSFEPLISAGPGPGRLVRNARTVAGRLRRALQGLMPGADPRRYERLFNVDRPRWRGVRRAAEPLRPLLHEHLDAAVLARALPPPDRRVGSRSPVQAGGPIRLLCGLAFLLDR